jgi:acetyl-CoA carboxylase carboxyl transferase subunit alpha
VAEASADAAPLGAWDRVKLARHPERPHALDFIAELTRDFVELHGDRSFGDDRALIGGLASVDGRTVMVLGHKRARIPRRTSPELRDGPPRGVPQGRPPAAPRREVRVPGDHLDRHARGGAGIGSEERGQSVAIAESLLTMADLAVPSVAVVIGEGGSGGALAIGVADRILMLENAVYAVASPEGCAAILWKDAGRAPEAAATMRITARELADFGIIDEVVAEPIPAHERPRDAIRATGAAISRHLAELLAAYPSSDPEGVPRLRDARYRKFRRIGAWREGIGRANGLPADFVSIS